MSASTTGLKHLVIFSAPSARGAVGLRGDLAERRPLLLIFELQVQVGVDPGVQRTFDRDVVAGFLRVAPHRLESIARGQRRAPCPDRLINAFLALEVIVHERRADPNARGHVLQRHAVVAELREQLFGGIENARNGRFANPRLVVWDTGTPRRPRALAALALVECVLMGLEAADLHQTRQRCRPDWSPWHGNAENPISSSPGAPLPQPARHQGIRRTQMHRVGSRAADGRSLISR